MKGCKNCPAYAKCIVTYRGSACAALRGTYGVDDDPEIVTNADRLRAMSDEGLQAFLWEVYCAGEADGYHSSFALEGFVWDLDWLRSPAEEEL